jgi:hypothetical protein
VLCPLGCICRRAAHTQLDTSTLGKHTRAKSYPGANLFLLSVRHFLSADRLLELQLRRRMRKCIHSSLLITHARLQKDAIIVCKSFSRCDIEFPHLTRKSNRCLARCIGKVLGSIYRVCVAECSLHLSRVCASFFNTRETRQALKGDTFD